jgi:O-antigen/teichoic acid export membrane protein
MQKIDRKVSEKSVFIWNIVGSMTRAASSIILLMMVTRICGASQAGIFSIAYATAQMLLTVGWYGMRAYQATDVRGRFEFSTYLASRAVTCMLMLLGDVLYIIISGYTAEKALVVFFICVLKMVDAVEDVYHGLLQLHGRLDLAGMLLTLRNVFSMVAFFLVLIFTKNLLVTCVVSAGASLAFCFLINIPIANHIERSQFNFSLQPLKKLFTDCFSLCASNFLSIYIYNAPKYAIDRLLTPEIQTYYNIIFMPAFVINLLSEVVFKPLLVELANLWAEHGLDRFSLLVSRLIKWIALITILTIGIAYFIGIPILSFVFGVDLAAYKTELLILLLGGGFGACAWLLNNVLTAMRKQKALLLGYMLASIFASIIAPVFVQKHQIMGASLTYLASIILLAFYFVGIFTLFLSKERSKLTEK